MSGATAEGTKKFVAEVLKRGGVVQAHFRETVGLSLSSIGLGTYLGPNDDRTDELYENAIVEAVPRGVNVLDSAINYRCQRSERAVGRALRRLSHQGVERGQIVVATKGGYIPFDGDPPEDAGAYVQKEFLDRDVLRAEDIVAGGHVLEPGFLRDQIGRSLENLGLGTIDIYYLHNPETQLSALGRAAFSSRIRAAFELMEESVSEGSIGFYGAATWNGFRTDPGSPDALSLAELVDLAREAGGESHHFRFVQAPYNLAMTELFTEKTQRMGVELVSLCRSAETLGVHLVSSATIAQGRLTQGLPDWLATLFKGLTTDTQRAVQFARSTPGMTTALIGMKTPEHVRENLEVARVAPVPVEDFLKLFEVDAGGE